MTYATLNDLITRAGLDEIRQVADRDRDGTPDPAVIEGALTHADNTVNGYVRARYAFPFVDVPDLVRTWAVSIARHFLHRNGPPDHVVADYKDALAALKDVSAGRIGLPVATAEGAVEPQAATGTVLASHPAEVFSATKLRGW